MTSHELAGLLLQMEDRTVYLQVKVVDSVGEVKLDVSKLNRISSSIDKDKIVLLGE